MKVLFLTFIFIVLVGSNLISARGVDVDRLFEHEIEEKNNYPGITSMLMAISALLKSFVSLMTGQGSVDDIVAAIQGLAIEISRMVSVQGLVGQIPIFGTVLQPIVGITAMILSNAPMLGGIISFALVGLAPAE